MVATAGAADPVVRAVLRCREQGYPVVLAYAGRPEPELLRLGRRSGVTVVDPAGSTEGDGCSRSTLTAAARANGHLGLLYHRNPDRWIDFAASEATFEESEEYAVETVCRTSESNLPRVVVAVPAYDEEASIGDVVSEATAHADEVVVVDDGSTDATAERAADAGATVVEHDRNRGYGAALRTAFREAARRRASHLVVIDGDGQHDPADVPRLVEAQRREGADVAIGSRFVDGAETDLPRYRRLGLSVVNWLTNLGLRDAAAADRVLDTQSGFRAYRGRTVETLAADDTIGDGMSASTDIIFHAAARGYSFTEVGVGVRYDGVDCSSHHPLVHGWWLLRNICRRFERRHPVAVLGLPGWLTAALGLWVGSTALDGPFGVRGLASPLGVAASLLVFVGLFAFFSGIALHSVNVVDRGGPE